MPVNGSDMCSSIKVGNDKPQEYYEHCKTKARTRTMLLIMEYLLSNSSDIFTVELIEHEDETPWDTRFYQIDVTLSKVVQKSY